MHTNATSKTTLDTPLYGEITRQGDQVILKLRGAWRFSALLDLSKLLSSYVNVHVLDGAALTALDTSAAGLLLKYLERHPGVQTTGFSDSHHRVLSLVQARLSTAGEVPKARQRQWLGMIGAQFVHIAGLVKEHIAFLGECMVATLSTLRQPRTFRGRETAVQCQQVGLNALPVVMLVTFLIGVVFAYLLGMQAQQYGANLYVIDGGAIGMTRELSPIIVAVIVAGRSGAAFTAQLGTMHLTEEKDAIRMLGLSPMKVLVMPRILANVTTLPLLVFVGNVASMLGVMMVCALMLDITPATFIQRLQMNLNIDHVYAGLIKAPVFALAIGVIACGMGMRASRDTRSIGTSTTSTVVQSIVAVILLDAAFAILFQEIDF